LLWVSKESWEIYDFVEKLENLQDCIQVAKMKDVVTKSVLQNILKTIHGIWMKDFDSMATNSVYLSI
jgi:hypothetical protein